ncbi:thiamine pyrophosphate-requiring protein [Puniceibacterium sediminis]|uniref:Acetolactate synthase-1/2/3 large subunit n=1 Tax=Puniceibacterium sediminis TaxID=1608407 RepID=A0A238Y727_9RHOB|nr:thiamine pyrophosphate-requiring protein [Puniceibacterium sediminis]SNR66591.1 acetolactate synthase-1/2/3 large subunit [Puniceibacterium sediminis]
MTTSPTPTGMRMTAGGALLARLKSIGVDYIFANSGTDFPPIIEGLAEAAAKNIDLPHAIIIPHESAAMGMAHGYYLATGRSQAVMAHTNVGLANCAIGAINAAVEHIPVLLFSGRTPTTEKDRFGTRTVPIGWGQEMRDQTALVREASKWDYELRFPEQVSEVADRAWAIANSTPKGPVYISMPREVLCMETPTDGLDLPPSMQPTTSHASAAQIAQAAEILATAQNPVIFAQHGTGSSAAFAALSQLADGWGIPVCQYWALSLAMPTDHPMAAAPDPAPLIARADAILVLDALAPWAPEIHKPAAGCKIIQMGQDPLSIRTPIRNFRSDLSIACDTADGILALKQAMDALHKDHAPRIPPRRTAVAAENAEARKQVLARSEAGRDGQMTKEWVSLCLSRAIKGRSASVLSELGCPMAPMSLDHHQAWYQEPHAGGLGWSFPAALGMQLADRDRLIVATMGDGSYMFSNPVACHQIAEALQLPLLIIIVNNAEWGAVRQSVLGIYPEGYAARTNKMPLTQLSPVPDFTKVAEGSRAWARRVETGADLPGALADALEHIAEHRGLALLDVRVRP